jgi:hypothetical protein
MVFQTEVSGDLADEGAAELRWHRAAAIGCAILFVLYAIWAFWLGYTTRRPVDFLSFWAAGRLALEGHAPLAYNHIAHKLMELTASPIQGWLPFPYPPPFLLFVTPLALFGIWPAFAIWVVGTSCLYLFATRKIAPLPYSLAHPAVLVNTWIGQNGFLTSGIFALGLGALAESPFIGGAIFGILVFKPQLGLLLPVAFIAGRHWRAVLGAAFSSLSLCLLAYSIFGLASYQAFFAALPNQAAIMANGEVAWNELATVYAFFRFFGVPENVAFAFQLTVALAAALETARVWYLHLSTRGAVLAAAALLVSPYLLTYDALLLIMPMGWYVVRRRRPLALIVLWIFSLLPIISYSGAYPGPNTIPLAAALCLVLLRKDEMSEEVENERSVPGRVAAESA